MKNSNLLTLASAAGKPKAEINDLYQSWFDSFAEALLIIDPINNQFFQMNNSACQLLGHSVNELMAAKVTDIFPDQIPQLIVFTQTILEKGTSLSQHFHIKNTEKDFIKLEIVGNAICLPGSGQTLVSLDLRDLTHRQKVEAKDEANHFIRKGIGEWKRIEFFFNDLERKNQLILNAAGEGIYGVNTEGMTTFVNPAAERMLGFSSEELVGKNMHMMVHHHHADGSHYHDHDCPIMGAFREGRVNHVTNEIFWRKNGSFFPVHYTSTPIMDHGSVVGAVIVFRDVSEQIDAHNQLQQALEEVSALKSRLEKENEYLQEEIRLEHNHQEIIGQGHAIELVIRQIDTVAGTDANVLIYGESGTGKELIARAIHESSNRKDRPLIRVNCAAIPHDLFESEFFGHIRGSFTGAVRDRVGRFELADHGTLLLDEVGEIPLELQSKLLRVIQEGQFERLGEEKTRDVNVRILAATNRNLIEEVAAGRFREDLYFRLNVFPIHSVPLRERIDDLPFLASHFFEKAKVRLNKPDVQLTYADIDIMKKYAWPGNVRELENMLERALILSDGNRLKLDLPSIGNSKICPGKNAIDSQCSGSGDFNFPMPNADLKALEEKNIRAALEQAHGRISGENGAAELLGMKATTLASRLKSLRIDKNEFKT